MPSDARRDRHCKVLGVSVTATNEEIKVAYKKLALKWHPDRHKYNKELAKDMFVEIHEAYRELLDIRDNRKDSTNGTRGSETSPPHSSGLKRPAPPQSPKSTSHPSPSGSGDPSTSTAHHHSPPSSPKPSTHSSSSSSRTSSSSRPNLDSRAPQSTPKPTPSPMPKAHDNSSSPRKPRGFPSQTHDKTSNPKTTVDSSSKPSNKAPSRRNPEPRTTPLSPKPSNASHFHETTRSDSSKHGVRPFFTRLRKKTRTGSFCQDRPPKQAVNPPKTSSEPTTEDILRDTHISSLLRPVMPPRGNSNEWIFPLKLSLEEMFHGTHYTFHITRHIQSDESKEVRIELDVPPGCHAGTRIRCPKVGHERKDGTVQDIVFVVEEAVHERFSRVKNDLFIDVRLPWVDSLSKEDGELCVKGIDDKEYSSTIPYASEGQTKGRFLVIGAGMPIRKGGKVVGRGDLTVRWELVVMPTSQTNTLKKGLHIRH